MSSSISHTSSVLPEQMPDIDRPWPIAPRPFFEGRLRRTENKAREACWRLANELHPVTNVAMSGASDGLSSPRRSDK